MKYHKSSHPSFARIFTSAFRDNELRGFALVLLVLLVIGTIFYAAVERWSVLDAFYYSAMVLTTIGSNTHGPVTVIGKLFTVIYIFIGLGSVLGFVAVLASHIHSKSK